MRAPVDLTRFFRPRAVALVGATDDQGKFGGRCLTQIMAFGFPGEIYPINPRRSEIAGRKCYPDVTSLPEAPDHVGIVVPVAHVVPTLRQCAARGVPFATVFTSGFGETGTAEGRRHQQDLADLVRETGLRVMGPNCNGLVNFVDRFALTSTAAITGPRVEAGNVGIVSHSGGLGQVNVMWRALQAGVPISYEVSCGNDADLDVLDYARFMVEDAASDVILMLVERIPDGARLAALAEEAADRKKPIIILKAGRTEAGSRAAASHTGALTGSDAVHDAAFAQYGLIRVHDCAELYETASLLRRRARPGGRRLAGMAISGGNAVLLADQGAMEGLSWPEYTPVTQEKLSEFMPGLAKVANPTDLTAAAIGQGDVFGRVLEIIAADDNIDTMVPILTFAPRAEIERVRDIARDATKPMAVLWSGGCTDARELDARYFAEAQVPMFRDTAPLLRAVARAAGHSEFLAHRAARTPPTRPAGIDPQAARRCLGDGGGALTEQASKAVLAAYGLPVTREALAITATDAARLAEGFGGKVALKIQSPDILHKTEAGGVRLDLSAGEIGAAFEAILAAAKSYAPQARIEGVLVQEMVPPGTELILGATIDPVFGPVLTIGLGGIFVEVFADVVHRLPPLSHQDAEEALRALKGWKLLEGVRGRPAADLASLTEAIVRLSWLIVDLADRIEELDINPIVAGPDGARIADALIVRKAAP